MKKILITLLLLLSSLASYGQLNKTDLSEYYRQVEVVSFGKNVGSVSYTPEGYILYGVSNDIYEILLHSIFLGSDKETAQNSLSELQNLDRSRTYMTQGELEFKTLIYCSDGKAVIVTDEVRGYSHILDKLSKESYKKASKAISAFEEPEWD